MGHPRRDGLCGPATVWEMKDLLALGYTGATQQTLFTSIFAVHDGRAQASFTHRALVRIESLTVSSSVIRYGA